MKAIYFKINRYPQFIFDDLKLLNDTSIVKDAFMMVKNRDPFKGNNYDYIPRKQGSAIRILLRLPL